MVAAVAAVAARANQTQEVRQQQLLKLQIKINHSYGLTVSLLNSSTGELDKTALNFNKDTYYVGFDANQGAEVQGQMVKDYIEKNIDKIDRNGDGVIGYVLAIGDIGHNDSIARTRGVRKALGTGVEKDGEINSAPTGTNTDGKAAEVQDAELEVNGKKYVVRELASQEMKNSAGATRTQQQQEMLLEHGHLLLEILLTWLFFVTTMEWECQCLTHGQKTTKFLHLDTMQTVMR